MCCTSLSGPWQVCLQTQHSRWTLWALCPSLQWPTLAGCQWHHRDAAWMPEWVMGQGSQTESRTRSMLTYLENEFNLINHTQPFEHRWISEQFIFVTFFLFMCVHAKSVSVMVTPRAVTLVEDCGSQQDGWVAACVTTASITQKVVTARTVRKVSTETPADQKLLQTPANVRPQCSLCVFSFSALHRHQLRTQVKRCSL